jgi:hypothetical protein
VNGAIQEVNAARAELADHDRLEAQRISNKIAKAEAALADAPLPASATPFADRIGVLPSNLDLIKAGLLAIRSGRSIDRANTINPRQETAK